MYQNCITAAFLAVCTYTDIRYWKVHKKVVLAYFILAASGRLAGGRTEWPEAAAGIVPGAVCLWISWATRQGLGYGDSILLLVCGISLGFQACVGLTLTAFFMAGIWAVILFCRYRAEQKRAFPFVPFLLISMFVQKIVEMG